MEASLFGVEVSELVPSEIQTAVAQNARKAEKALTDDSPYSVFTRDFEKFSLERFKNAAPVEKLVKVVLQALRDKPMKRRYLVKARGPRPVFPQKVPARFSPGSGPGLPISLVQAPPGHWERRNLVLFLG